MIQSLKKSKFSLTQYITHILTHRGLITLNACPPFAIAHFAPCFAWPIMSSLLLTKNQSAIEKKILEDFYE